MKKSAIGARRSMQAKWSAVLAMAVGLSLSSSALRAQTPDSAQPAAPASGTASNVAEAATADRLTAEQINAQWLAAAAEFAPERRQILASVDRTIAAGPYRDDWQSLATQPVPAWFADAKFGIFIHWGVFSVPAFGSEWYSRNMYQAGDPAFAYHREHFGDQAVFGYKDFIPMFRMQHFDPAAWAALFRAAGARYVVPVAEHHDGFSLYNSHLSRWTAVKMGPRQDLVAELGEAVHADGLHFGVSLHRAEHDWFFDGGRHFRSDVNDPRYAGLYGPAELRMEQGKDDSSIQLDFTYVSHEFRQDWLARAADLTELYHPELVYFDWWVGSPDFRETQRRFAAFYYDQAAARRQPVVMFTKYHDMSQGSAVPDVERGSMDGIQPGPWQTDTSISNASWGYVEHDTYKSPEVLVDQLVDIVSKNGNLLLNIGPRADGTIPDVIQQTLRSMGTWLHTNGEAIYGSRPWTRYSEGPTQAAAGTFQDSKAEAYTPADFRFTTRAGLLYAFEMRPAAADAQGTHTAVIHSLPLGSSGVPLGSSGVPLGSSGVVRKVSLLGYDGDVTWQQRENGLAVVLPPGAARSTLPLVFRIELTVPAGPRP